METNRSLQNVLQSSTCAPQIRLVWVLGLLFLAACCLPTSVICGQSPLTVTATASSINAAYRVRDLWIDYDRRNALHLVVEGGAGKNTLAGPTIKPSDATMAYDLGTIPMFEGDISRMKDFSFDPRLKEPGARPPSPLEILYEDRDTKQKVGFRLRFAGGLYCSNTLPIVVKGSPGESREVQITLSNPGAVDLVVSCWISRGNDRVQLKQDMIAVQMGKTVNLPVTVLIPKASKPGEKLGSELTFEYSIDVWQKEGKPQAPNQATQLTKSFQVPIQIEVESEEDTIPTVKAQPRPGLKLTKESKTELHFTTRMDQLYPTDFVEVTNSGQAAATVRVEASRQWLSLGSGQANQFLLQPGETQKIKFVYSPNPAVPASHNFEGVAKISLDTRQYADMEPVVITVPLFGTFTKPDDPCSIWHKGQKILRTRPLRPTYSKEGQVVDYTLTMVNCKCIPVTGEMKGAVNVTGFDKGKQQVHIAIKAPPKGSGPEQLQKVMFGGGNDTIAIYYQRTADYIPKEPTKYRLYSYPDYLPIEKITGMPEGGAAAFYLEFPEYVNLPKQLRLLLKGGETSLDTLVDVEMERKDPYHPRSVLMFINATNGLGSSMLEILGSDGKKLVDAEIEIDSREPEYSLVPMLLLAVVALIALLFAAAFYSRSRRLQRLNMEYLQKINAQTSTVQVMESTVAGFGAWGEMLQWMEAVHAQLFQACQTMQFGSPYRMFFEQLLNGQDASGFPYLLSYMRSPEQLMPLFGIQSGTYEERPLAQVYRSWVVPYLLPPVQALLRLHAHTEVVGGEGVPALRQSMAQSGIDVAAIAKASQLTQLFFREHLQLNLYCVGLYQDQYAMDQYDLGEASPLENHLRPYQSLIAQLPAGTIVDMRAAGLHSDSLQVDQKPIVVVNRLS